jgi:ABC-type multidrug transport system ATPase subunit
VFKINFGVKNDQLFCLLGHNGAGKTTTFNMLSGMFPPTKGDAYIFGKSVRHELRQVQGMMGICPQHDVLWSELSATEHLSLFAGLSLVQPSKIPDLIHYFLDAVDLVEPGNTPSGKYSGGMRRRLSVACALIADPNVVYLDEPTTGMDPVNRRGVWDVIEKAKKDRVVVLTTHAMEEADTLGDVISIMSRGRLHCLGTSLHLKNKYGSGYHVDVTSTEANHTAVGSLLGEKLSSGHRPVGATQFSADVPLTNVPELQALCAAVEGDEGKRLEMDISVSMCTLENVFIKIAKQAKDPEAVKQSLGSAGTHRVGGTVTVSVPCPEGKAGGDAVQIVHEGASYDLTVPDGVTEGQSFQVQLPSVGGVAASASQPNDNSMHAGSELGDDPLPDTEGLLTQHLQFRGTPFGTQFRALFIKNMITMKRQPGVNICVMLLTALMMSILILLKLLPGLIGEPQIFVCGTNITSDRSYADKLTIPNVEILKGVQDSFSTISLMESCTDADSKNATEWTKLSGWVGSSMCSTSSTAADIGASNRARMLRAFETYGCRIPSAPYRS